MTFPEPNAPLRNDVSSNAFEDEDHHKGISPLVELNIGMVSQFPQEHMHLVCLWVVKRLLLLRFKSNIWFNAFFERLCSLRIFSQTLFLRCYWPLEGNWIQTIFIIHWTNSPTECCASKHIKHFLLLFVAMHILLN